MNVGLLNILADLSVLPVLYTTTEHYAALFHELRKAGTPDSDQRRLDCCALSRAPFAAGQLAIDISA